MFDPNSMTPAPVAIKIQEEVEKVINTQMLQDGPGDRELLDKWIRKVQEAVMNDLDCQRIFNERIMEYLEDEIDSEIWNHVSNPEYGMR